MELWVRMVPTVLRCKVALISDSTLVSVVPLAWSNKPFETVRSSNTKSSTKFNIQQVPVRNLVVILSGGWAKRSVRLILTLINRFSNYTVEARGDNTILGTKGKYNLSAYERQKANNVHGKYFVHVDAT